MATANQVAAVTFVVAGKTEETVGRTEPAVFNVVHAQPTLLDALVSIRYADGHEEVVYQNGGFVVPFGISLTSTSQNPNDACYTTRFEIRRIGGYKQNFDLIVKAVDARAPQGAVPGGVVSVRVISPCESVKRPDAVVLEIDDIMDRVRTFNITGTYDNIERFPVFDSDTGYYAGFANDSKTNGRYFEDLYPDTSYVDPVSGQTVNLDLTKAGFFNKYNQRVAQFLTVRPNAGWELPPKLRFEAILRTGDKVVIDLDLSQNLCQVPSDRNRPNPV